jgi:hypothetical protein
MVTKIIYSKNSCHRLLYYSRARSEVMASLDTEFPAILKVAVTRNTGDEITGALLACDGWFVQALEGEHVKVVQTFDRISRDKRHSDISLIKAEAVPDRLFAKWSMCGRRLSPTDDAILDVLEGRKAFDPKKLNPVNTLNLLLSVTKIMSPHG